MSENLIEVGTRVDVGPIQSGMQQAAQAVASSSQQVTTSLNAVNDITERVQQAMRDNNAVLAQGGKAFETYSKAAAAATDAGATFYESVEAGMAAVREATAAQDGLNAATARASSSAAHSVTDVMAASAAVRTLSGGLQNNVRAAERFLVTTLNLGEVLQGTFQIFGAIALADVFLKIGKEAYKAYQNIVLLKQANEDLDAIDLKTAADSKQLEDALHRQQQKYIELTQGVEAAARAQLNYDATKPVDLSKFFNDAQFRKLSDNIKEDSETLFKSFDPSQFGAKIDAAKAKIKELQQQIANPVIVTGAATGQTINLTDAPKLEAQKRLYEDILTELTDRQKLYEQTVQTETAQVAKDHQDAAKKTEQAWSKTQKEIEKGIKQQDKMQTEAWQRQAQIFREQTKAASEGIKEQERLNQKLDDSLTKQMEGEVKKKQEAVAQETAALRASIDSDISLAQQAYNAQVQHIDAQYRAKQLSINQQITALKKAADDEYQIESDKIQALITLDKLNPDKPAQLQKDLDKAKELWQQHAIQIQKINAQAVTEQQQKWTQFFNSFRSTFESTINGLAMRTESLGQAVGRVFDDMLGAGLKFLENLAINWVEQHVFMALFAKSTQTTAGISEVMSNAAVAASAAYASAAAIPIVGWTIAPGAASAAYSEVSAFAPLASAAGGWADIPRDQLAMVHKNEMVLPADLAANVRSMSGGGVHFHGGITINSSSSQQSADEIIALVRRGLRFGY